MTNTYINQGRQFVDLLDMAHDKDKMFKLLFATLEKFGALENNQNNTPDIINGLTDQDSIAMLKASKANVNACNGAFMFMEDYIYLTEKKYHDHNFGGIKDFKKDFSKFVQESKMQNNQSKENGLPSPLSLKNFDHTA